MKALGKFQRGKEEPKNLLIMLSDDEVLTQSVTLSVWTWYEFFGYLDSVRTMHCLIEHFSP
jgi:hypothetical protein